MTEHLPGPARVTGTRTGWRTAALVAPAAAVLFAGTTTWAQSHAPAAGGTGGTGTSSQSSGSAPGTDAATREALAADERKLADLQRRLDALMAQAKANGCDTGTIPGGSANPPAQHAAPAPPAHTTTGASGARK